MLIMLSMLFTIARKETRKEDFRMSRNGKNNKKHLI